jgi:hypothetical protein
MTPGDVYQTITSRHPSAESRRYLYKVNTAQKRLPPQIILLQRPCFLKGASFCYTQ